MREIKFRAKALEGDKITIKKGDCVYGYYVEKKWEHPTDEFQSYDKSYIFDKNIEDYIEVDKETVGQYTGRKDKKGKEIYEKDRVTTNHYSNTWSGRKGVIEWLPNSAKFIITNGKTGYKRETCGINNVVKITGTII